MTTTPAKRFRALDFYSFGDIAYNDSGDHFIIDRVDGGLAYVFPITNGQAATSASHPVVVGLPNTGDGALPDRMPAGARSFPLFRTGKNFYF